MGSISILSLYPMFWAASMVNISSIVFKPFYVLKLKISQKLPRLCRFDFTLCIFHFRTPPLINCWQGGNFTFVIFFWVVFWKCICRRKLISIVYININVISINIKLISLPLIKSFIKLTEAQKYFRFLTSFLTLKSCPNF